MRHIVLAAALSLLVGAAAADPIEGIWQTEPDEGSFAHVAIAPCGAAFCGTISRTFKDGAAYDSPHIGRQIVIDMTPRGNGDYAGQVWRPSNDKIYSGKARLAGNQMSLSGCIAGGLLCKSQDWVRVR